MSTALELPISLSHMDNLFEVIDGVEVEKPEGNRESMTICSRLSGEILVYAKPKGLGETYVEALIHLSPIRDRRPSFTYVSYETWPRNQSLLTENAWEIVPELCVEVIRPLSLAVDIEDRLEEYFEAGVKQVWVVYPRNALVKVYRTLRKHTLLGLEDTLTGGELLPGFELPLKELFRELAAKKG